jgi:hypothetical protein
MSVYEIDPLRDPRWPDFLEEHPRASIFHTRGWLEALKRTYGYEPVAYTTTAPGAPLTNGWVFCRIRSWLTGHRLVSLPFSDHCDPLLENSENLEEISQAVQHAWEENRWRYIECRLEFTQRVPDNFVKCEQPHTHKLSLQPELDELFRNLHKNSTQRKIKVAEREAVTYEAGRSGALLDWFYHLLVLTRRRHRVPPQPRKWFSNLLNCLGSQLTIRVASSREKPVASIITLRFKNTLVYKYGGADERFFRLGGMQMLFWRAIVEAKENQVSEFDLGRSDLTSKGLILFKDRLGASRSSLSYCRYPASVDAIALSDRMRAREKFLSYIPDRVITAGGPLLYRHFG